MFCKVNCTLVFLSGLLFVVCCQLEAKAPHARHRPGAFLKDQTLEINLQNLLHIQNIDEVIKELNHRANSQRGFERSLIQCLQTEAASPKGEIVRRLAAKLLGELRSEAAVPILVDNISMRWEKVAVSEESMLGEIRIFYPCVRALVELGERAEPVIIKRVAERNDIDELDLDLLSFTLLKIRTGKKAVGSTIDDSVRADLCATVEKVLEKTEGNTAALKRLVEIIGTADNEYFKKRILRQ